MADYTRHTRRFFNKGMSLVPPDALPDGKNAFLQNVRSYQEGTITPRAGTTLQSSAPLGAPVHSLFRLNDTTPFGGANPERRFAGAGTALFGGSPGLSGYGNVNAALVFSGNPLTAVVAAPVDSPRPYIYVADEDVMRKVNSDFQDSAIGLPPPTAPPTALYGAIQVTHADPMGGAAPGSWNEYGASVGPTNIVLRLSATVTAIVYDSGVTGMASVAFDNMTGIVRGCTIDFDLSPAPVDKVIVQEVHPPVVDTTIAAIQYDAGTSGLCTIQPTGSLSTGQIEAPVPEDVRRRYEQLNQPIPPRVSVTRTVDFPVDSLVTLNGLETVRILSVAYGDNGEMSFRCSTSGTFAAGNTIAGVACIRAYLTLTHTVGTIVIGFARQNSITANASDPVVGGVQESPLSTAGEWGKVGTQATQPSDIIRFGFRADQFGLVQAVRLYLNVDLSSVTFLLNYFLYEWRQSDLATAVQSVAGTGTGLMADAQASAVTQGQVDAQYGDQYAQGFQRGLSPNVAAMRAAQDATGRIIDRVQPFIRGFGLHEVANRALRGAVSIGATQSRQLTLGDDQWVWLECRVGDLSRIGTDVTRTLNDINGFAIAVQIAADAATPTVVVEFGDMYLTGGYGPDAGPTLAPYVYRYRWRRESTGERGNPSPPMRAGVAPQRGLMNLTGAAGPTADTITDWFRFGGALARWAYVGSSIAGANPPVLADDRADVQIDGGETLRQDLFQPWPTYDLPRTGIANVAGTSLTWVSGDTFNTGWAADSLIIINGRATSLYQQPASTTRLHVVDNIGAGTNVTWQMPSPTLLGQALGAIWGGAIEGTWFNFACGDPSDPGLLHWTYGNDPDASSERNTLVVTSASEPLQNGYFDDGVPYAFSTDRLYRIVPTFGQVSDFRAVETQCTKGLWSRWFMCVTDDGVFFGNKSGIYLTQGGGEAQSLIDGDLRRIFPQDGIIGQTVGGVIPPDFSQTTRLKLSYIDRRLYFDYADQGGQSRTLVLDPVNGWSLDVYGSGVYSRICEPGRQVHTNLMGAADGNLHLAEEDATDDSGVAIDWAVYTPLENGDDPRASKQWGDCVVDAIPGDGGYTVTPVIDNAVTALTATVVAASLVRTTSIVGLSQSGEAAVLSRNLGLRITGTVPASGEGAAGKPILYLWEPSFIPKQTIITRRVTDWENLGYIGAKYIQGVVIRANTFNAEKAVQAQFEGGHIGKAFTLLHDGETQYAYPIQDGGWTPFVAELVRLVGVDDLPWVLYDWRWVWEPAPEAATQWETQYTTFDLPGYMAAADGIFAYQSTCPVDVQIWHDDAIANYILPATATEYEREFLRFEAAKGKAIKFRLTSSAPFRLFQKDTIIRVQGWGVGDGYQMVRPFGGPSRESGAQI